MLTPPVVQEQLSTAFQPYSAYIAQIANVCIQADSDSENMLLYSVIPDADETAKATPTPQAFLAAFIEGLKVNEVRPGVIDQVRRVPLPVANAAPALVAPGSLNNYRAQHASDLARIRQLRTKKNIENGSKLAAAAIRMQNWFF